MKAFKRYLTVLSIVLFIAYVLGTFVEANFNIVEWSKNTRSILAFMMGFSLLAYAITDSISEL